MCVWKYCGLNVKLACYVFFFVCRLAALFFVSSLYAANHSPNPAPEETSGGCFSMYFRRLFAQLVQGRASGRRLTKALILLFSSWLGRSPWAEATSARNFQACPPQSLGSEDFLVAFMNRTHRRGYPWWLWVFGSRLRVFSVPLSTSSTAGTVEGYPSRRCRSRRRGGCFYRRSPCTILNCCSIFYEGVFV